MIDITPYWAQKQALIRAFSSQFFDPAASPEELPTPISSESFWHFLEGRARDFGRPAGFEMAEGFNVSRTMGVSNLFDLV